MAKRCTGDPKQDHNNCLGHYVDVGQCADERQADELARAAAAAHFLATAQEWSARLDHFCDELEARGLTVTRDGWSVTIDIRPRPPE